MYQAPIMYQILFNPQNDSIKEVLLSLVYSGINWNLEALNNLQKFLQA